GGALLNVLDQLIGKELMVPFLVAAHPMDCVADGTGVLLDNMDKLSKLKLR
ncbi:rod shape-determining protein, partial [Bacillus amyloliquefaciens]|uniref:rod shape-determining protein n=1 Tax=Bacillus amyloliquefaciens TaxID=1390 RepID=UPI00283FF8D7